MPPLGQWLLSFGVPSVLSIVATYAIMRVIFREYLCAAIDGEVQAAPLNGDGKLVLAGLAVMVLVLLTASSLKKDLGLPACLAALAITAAVSIKAESNPLRLARDISWGTLVLVAGLFIMVDAAENIGALKLTQAWLAWAQKLAPVAGAFITGFAVGVSKQFGQQSSAWTDRWWQSSGGARERSDRQCHTHRCRFGAELISYGLMATILWLLALRKEKLDVSFWSFLKVGVLAMPAALFLSISGAIVMQMLYRTL
jgi:arsenical pump membrane protein